MKDIPRLSIIFILPFAFGLFLLSCKQNASIQHTVNHYLNQLAKAAGLSSSTNAPVPTNINVSWIAYPSNKLLEQYIPNSLLADLPNALISACQLQDLTPTKQAAQRLGQGSIQQLESALVLIHKLQHCHISARSSDIQQQAEWQLQLDALAQQTQRRLSAWYNNVVTTHAVFAHYLQVKGPILTIEEIAQIEQGLVNLKPIEKISRLRYSNNLTPNLVNQEQLSIALPLGRYFYTLEWLAAQLETANKLFSQQQLSACESTDNLREQHELSQLYSTTFNKPISEYLANLAKLHSTIEPMLSVWHDTSLTTNRFGIQYLQTGNYSIYQRYTALLNQHYQHWENYFNRCGITTK